MNFTKEFIEIIKAKLQEENLEIDIEEALSILSMYTSIHNHSEISNFRLTDSIVKIEDILNHSLELQYSGVALTDHEAISGHIDLIKRFIELKKIKEKYKSNKDDEDALKNYEKNKTQIDNLSDDFKLILGNEIYLVDDMEDVTTNYVSGETKFWHFILLAKNKQGYKTLREISSSAWDNHFKHGRMERVPTIKGKLEEIMKKNNSKGDIIASTACLGGEFANLVLKYCYTGDEQYKKEINKFIKWGIRVFGKEDFYIELQPSPYLPVEPFEESHEQIVFNKFATRIAKGYGLNHIFATDTHYLKKEHRTVHASYLNSDEDNNGERELGDFYATTYMWEIEELIKSLLGHLTLREVIDGFKGTMKIHAGIENYDMYMPTIVPRDKHIPDFK